MKLNSIKQSFNCSVCSRPCKHSKYGVKSCESCKHFFRRSILLMKEYKCTNGGKCEIEKNYAVCKRCRLNKCLTVGMNPRGVCVTKIDEERMLAFVQRIKQQPPKDALTLGDEKSRGTGAKAIVIDPPNNPRAANFEINHLGPFISKSPYFAMDLIFVFKIVKTFPSFEQLIISDKIALYSNIAMPLVVLSKGFYSVQQNSDVICDPSSGVIGINTITNSCFNGDSITMKMGDQLLCNAIQPFSHRKLSTEEFVLVRAIVYSHMVTPGLSDHGQKLLFSEAEKYSSLLMRNLQMNYGRAPGALRYVELMGMIECLFNTGANLRKLFTTQFCPIVSHSAGPKLHQRVRRIAPIVTVLISD
ncbi:hypothetical protein niasHT_010461 [Heterodera trifolii]|uniref:Nuclear receptor domain-containing protein n=1 Tax=Heterodera trifolii TaxID=157864 RepID=A0ABD2MAS0_9BILA